MNKNTTKQKNILRELLLGDDIQKVNQTSIASIFRSLIEPMIECKRDSVILVKLNDGHSFENVIKRINFLNPNIYSFSKGMDFLKNVQENNILEKSEFLIILSPRYSAAMVWDYSWGQELGYEEGTTPFYLKMNSRVVNEVAENLLLSVDLDIMDLVKQYTPERRANTDLNNAIHNIIKALDDFSTESNLAQIQNNLDIFENKNEQTTCNDSIVRNISHEIKNHLSVIDLYSKIIEKKIDLVIGNNDEDTHSSCTNALNSIRKSIFSISFLLNSLKSDEIKSEALDLNSVVQNAIKLATPKMNSQGIELKFDIPENLMILVDEIKFQNVILNLLYNSIDAINGAGEISISTERQERFVKLFVRDTGKGFNPEEVNNLFKEGFTTKETGQGLGLSICKATMLKMGGDIRLQKSENGCTVFEIIAPLA